MIVHLRPAALESQGLAVALGKHVDVLRRTHERDIALRIDGDAPVAAADAFRIAHARDRGPAADAAHMLEAIGGRELVERSYAAAPAGGYLWHEFGDVHLILP